MLKRTAIGLVLALLAAMPARAQDYLGTSFDALLPIVVVVGLVMAGLVFWGRKKPKTRSKRRKHK